MAGMTRKTKVLPEKMKNERGELKDGQDRNKVWTKDFEKLGRRHGPVSGDSDEKVAETLAEQTEQSQHEHTPELDNEITLDEVTAAVKKLKKHKAQGVDGIPNELMIYGGDGFTETLHRLIQTIWKLERVPQDWADGLVVPIYKDGDREITSNYRGITLLSTVETVFGKIMNSRLMAWNEKNGKISDEQGGFRPGRGCVDQLFVITEMLTARKHEKKKTWSCFIDVSKAYDRMLERASGPRCMIWESRVRCGEYSRTCTVIRAAAC